MKKKNNGGNAKRRKWTNKEISNDNTCRAAIKLCKKNYGLLFTDAVKMLRGEITA